MIMVLIFGLVSNVGFAEGYHHDPVRVSATTVTYRIPEVIRQVCDENVDLPKFKERMTAAFAAYDQKVMSKIELTGECLVYNDGLYCSGGVDKNTYCKRQEALLNNFEVFLKELYPSPNALPHLHLSNIIAHRVVCGKQLAQSSVSSDDALTRCEAIR
jgi:hypothetical protein